MVTQQSSIAGDAYKLLEIKRVSPALGAEIRGVDLNRLDEPTFSEIKQAFAEFGVLFFRNQTLTPESHIAFAERFGEINVNRFFRRVDGYPMIAEVRKDPDDRRNTGATWHTDHSYDEIPAMCSILHAREVPPVGGDTLFASMYEAYDQLSDGLKDTLHNLKALHSSRHTFGYAAVNADPEDAKKYQNADQATQDSLHPVVIRHPLSGRKALYVNPDFTLRFDGWTEAESKPLLEYLYAHATQAEFCYRFNWEKHSVAMWDNRATMHMALNDYHGYRRVMHRITVEGVPLTAAA